jgi:hypothetical protein
MAQDQALLCSTDYQQDHGLGWNILLPRPTAGHSYRLGRLIKGAYVLAAGT